jgi:triacylglycerol esterase/lipase EstA (alpha/beta hydrolase family)
MPKNLLPLLAAALALCLSNPALARTANKTAYPIVFAHGMAGFDDILGYDYWGDDYGVYVLDTCQWGEYYCNPDIHYNQQSFVASVTPFQSSEQRGYELYQDILGYMASTGVSHVNIVGHSQGGLDLRKAAKLLYQNKGYTVVKYGISISSPHRGSPIAKYVYRLNPGVQSVLAALAKYFGDVIYGPGNDAYAALKQLIHDDIDPNDGITTGTKAFNAKYPVSGTYIARSRSFLTGQDNYNMNPALYLLKEAWTTIDGDGYATTDANGDGALGTGDGDPHDNDDDGLVGINSQQMGYRLEYWECYGCLDYVWQQTDTGFVGNLNAPDATQMTSHKWKINQDHLDVIGVPPDTFDEMEFYAAITDYIADNGY